MKTNFIPQRFFGPGDPAGNGSSGGILGALGGATPWGAILQGVGGLAQSIIGGIQAHKAQKALQNLKTPTYTPNQSILNYYNQALQRYNVNPYSTNLYKQQVQQGQRGLATALSSLRERGNPNAGLSSLLQGYNDSLLGAGTQAEQLQNQKFSQLGGATQLKQGEDQQAFNINQMLPYQKQYALLAAKAGGGNQILNAGLSNIFGGINSAQQYGMINKMYGQ